MNSVIIGRYNYLQKRQNYYSIAGFIGFSLINIAIALMVPGLRIHQVVSALLISGVEAVFLSDLLRKKSSTLIIMMAALFLSLHPLVIWAVAAGNGLELAFYFLLAQTLFALMRYGDVRSIINVAFCIAASIFIDQRFIYVVPVLIPLLAFLAPPDMIRKSPGSFFLLLLFPATAMIGGLFYADAILQGIHFNFIDENAFAGADQFPWLILPVLSLFTFPLALAAPLLLRKERLVAMPILVLTIAPIVAAFLAIQTGFFRHPVSIILLLAVPTMSAASELIGRNRTGPVLALLALGWLGSLATLIFFPTPIVNQLIFFFNGV